MNDRDLERRLQAHFHATLDGAQPSPELRAAVAQVFTTPVRHVGRFDIRSRFHASPWGLVAAAVAVSVVAITVATIGLSVGPRPGAQSSSPATPFPTTSQERMFVVVPPGGEVPDKGASSLASDVLAARLRALGFGNFTSGVGYGMQFRVPEDGPSDESTRRVLSATGDVEFVPLPDADYGEGKLVAEVGKPLPKDEPALFGWEGIEHVEQGTDQQDRPTLSFTLKPAARDAFGDYTTGHVLGSIAVVVDGRVALLPTINEPITNGQIAISSGSLPGQEGPSFIETTAILVGGMLPEAWRGAGVPPVVPQDIATAAAQRGLPDSTVDSADIEFFYEGDAWNVLWAVVLLGTFPYDCHAGDISASTCPPAPNALILVDGSTGVVVSREFPAP